MKTFKKFLSLTTAAAILFSSLITAVPVYAEESGDAPFSARLNELMPRDKNYMFSPYSLKLALAMTANGAQGKTREELLEVLDISDLDNFNAEVQKTMKRYNISEPADTDYIPFIFNIANSIWLNTDPKYNSSGMVFSPEFKEKVGEYYLAEADTVTSGDALEKINGWCSKKTNGKIPTILDEPNFLSCLVNAVYFNAKWENRFSEENTFEEIFTDRDGGIATLDFMHQTDKFAYYEDENVQIVELPYENSSFSMYLVLSGDKRVDISDCLDKMSENGGIAKVELSMPKFNVEYEEKMNEHFKDLGAEAPFGESTDLSPMFDKESLFYISSIIHKTYISVDEEGTEAAAVTAVTTVESTGGGGPALPHKVFKADRPFTFVIADRFYHDIYFMGEYAYGDDSDYKPVTVPSRGYKLGDADNDKKLTAADAAYTLQKALVSTFETPLEKDDPENLTVTEKNVTYSRTAVMDMNRNGVIDADDSMRIMQNVLGTK